MKRIILVLASGLIALNSFSQSNCKIEEEYQAIFKIKKMKYGEREYLVKIVNTIDSNSCFSDLVNNNAQYIDYLRTNFSDNTNYEQLININDTVELQNAFIRSLENDSTFNSVMHQLTERFTNQSHYIPDTISIDELLNIAVKYFLIIEITEKGFYAGKVCTGFNGLKQTEKIRKPQVEAFCFTAILNNYQGEQFNMYNEFVKGIKELYKINLGIDKGERLLRAQGAMYMYMRHNENLKRLLIYEYGKKKEYLPFVLKIE